MANEILDRFDAMFQSFGTIDKAAQTGSKAIYTMTCTATGEAQQVVVCAVCAAKMPLVNGDDVKVALADDDCACEFCDA